MADGSEQQRSGGEFVRRMALFYGSAFVVLGVHLPFLPVWLSARGLDAEAIGVVLSLPMLLRLFVIPLATRAADRRDALRAEIIGAALVGLFGFAALAFARGVVVIGTLFAIATTAFMLLFVLSDVYALRGLAPHRRAYGPVRMWGSAAFIAANLAAGYALDVIDDRDLIWLVVAAMAVCVVAGWALPPLAARAAGGPAAAASGRILLRNPAFLAMVAAASLIQGSHALYYGFTTIDWQAAGYGGGTIGLLWALGVLAEVVLFACSARLPAWLGPGLLIAIGGAGALVRWIAMASALPGAVLPLLQCLHALSFAATHLGTLAFIWRVAPVGLTATAQGYLAVASGTVMAASTGVCGLLYGRLGATAYAAMAVLAALGFIAALAALRLQPPESDRSRY